MHLVHITCTVVEDSGMPILPIDTGRYGTPEMRRIFEENHRLQTMLDVEAALAWVHGEVGNIPKVDAQRIVEKASTNYVKLDRVKEIEKDIRHDIMSLVRALAEVCGESGAYVHLGATSSDIVDTSMALQLRDAVDQVEKRLNHLEKTMMEKAERYKETVMIGRTHGQHALPITFGFKVSVWMREISRHIARLHDARERVLVGKMSGAVGTHAGLGPKAFEIQ